MTTSMLFVLFCFVYYGNSMLSATNNMRKMEKEKFKNNKLIDFCNANPSVCNKYYQPMTSFMQKDNKQNNNVNELFELRDVDKNLDLDQQLNLDMNELERRKINSEQHEETKVINSNENLYSDQQLQYDINRLRTSEVEDARLLEEESESDNNRRENLDNNLDIWEENIDDTDNNDDTPKKLKQKKNLHSDQKNFLKYIDDMESQAFLLGKKDLKEDINENVNHGFTKHYERSTTLGNKEDEWQPLDIFKKSSSVQFLNERPAVSHHKLHQQQKNQHQRKRQYQYLEKRQQLQNQLKRQNSNQQQLKRQHSVKQLRQNDMQQLKQQQHSRKQQQSDLHLFHYKMIGQSSPSPSKIFFKQHKIDEANIGNIYASYDKNNLRQYASDRLTKRKADPHASKHNVKLVHGRFRSFPSVSIHNVHRVHSHRKHHLPNVSILYLKKHQ